jgi:hypothetical protein
MVEKRVKLRIPGLSPDLLDAVEVPVEESNERWTEVKLKDGATLRIKVVILGAVRVEGRFDQEGNPIYSIRANQIMTVSDVPDHLKKPEPSATKH